METSTIIRPHCTDPGAPTVTFRRSHESAELRLARRYPAAEHPRRRLLLSRR
jgi:hypothetical protein